MDVHQLGEVFNEAGLPEITYVPPAEAQRLKGSLATPGKHVTLVGPSGSGKSTVANRVLADLNFPLSDIHVMSGRSHVGAGSILEVFGREFGVAPSLDEIEPWLKVYKLVMIESFSPDLELPKAPTARRCWSATQPTHLPIPARTPRPTGQRDRGLSDGGS